MDAEVLIMAERIDLTKIKAPLYNRLELIAYAIDSTGNYNALNTLTEKPEIITLYAIGPTKKTAVRDYEVGRSLRKSIDGAIKDAIEVSKAVNMPLMPTFKF